MKNIFNTLHRCGYSNLGIARRLGIPEKSIRLVKGNRDLFFDLLYGTGKSFKNRKRIRKGLKAMIKAANLRKAANKRANATPKGKHKSQN